MHALEILAIRSGLSTRKSRTPVVYKCFVDSAKSNGRVYELGVMIKLFLRINPFSTLKLAPVMAPVGLGLFLHKRLPLKPSRIKGVAELKAILDKAQALRGAK